MKIDGWQKVFKFTYIQNIKNKAFIIGTSVMAFIIILMILGINFIPPMVMGNDESDAAESGETGVFSPVTKIYLFNESGIDEELDLSVFTGQGITVNSITAAELNETTNTVRDSQIAEIMTHISRTDYGYSILVSRPANEEVLEKSVCDTVASVFSGLLNTAKLKSTGVSEESIAEINKGISVNTTIAGEPPKSEFAYIINSFIPMMSSMVLFIFIFAYGQLIAQAIASEKTSRVMELLLTSVRPLAVIIGKILAIGLVSLTQLVAMSVLAGTVFALSAPFGLLGQMIGSVNASSPEIQLAADEIKLAFGSFAPMTIVWIIVLFILGFLFYALIAGLIGASISRLEDLNVAMQPLVLIGLLGFYLSYMPSAFSAVSDGVNTLTIVARYLPISSPFALPSALILGEMGALETVVSVAILALFDVLMLLVVAKVYESVVLHNGDRIKIKDIVKLVKSK